MRIALLSVIIFVALLLVMMYFGLVAGMASGLGAGVLVLLALTVFTIRTGRATKEGRR